MSEQDYINASALARVRCATAILEDIRTVDDDLVDPTEWKQVLNSLRKWESGLHYLVTGEKTDDWGEYWG